MGRKTLAPARPGYCYPEPHLSLDPESGGVFPDRILKKETKKDKIYGYPHGPPGTQAAVISDMLIFSVKAIDIPVCPLRNLKRGHLKEIKGQISDKQCLFHQLFCCLCNPSYFSVRDHLKFWGPLSRLSIVVEALKSRPLASHC